MKHLIKNDLNFSFDFQANINLFSIKNNVRAVLGSKSKEVILIKIVLNLTWETLVSMAPNSVMECRAFQFAESLGLRIISKDK